MSEEEIIEEDPRMLINEEELVEYLSELSKVSDIVEFALEEFKYWSGIN
jgi:tetrahydromethanopterin S-methyltransferase subunit G